MGEKIKKLLRMFFSNKKVLFLTLGLILFLSFVPFYSAKANIFSDIFGVITNIGTLLTFGMPLAIITVALYAGALLMAWVSAAISAILKQVIVASLSIPVMPGAGIDVVNAGWSFSRDFVNIIFILILVFIGLATILRLQTYQAKKTLPLLIIIALLVNFSGVIVGFVVDIGNLVTNFFIEKIGSLDLAFGATREIGESFLMGVVGIFTNITDLGAVFVPAAKAAILLFFFAILTLVLFITMLLFIVRVGVLWILTILAPLAFAAYILPATKKWWSQWWQQLIQWSIIGIPIAFFLYLAQIAVTHLGSITDKFKVGWSLTGPDPGLAGLILDLTGPITALLLLAVGIMISMQMAPSGAQGVINFGKKAGMGAIKIGGLAAGVTLGRRISPEVETWGKRLAERGEKPSEIPEGAGFLRRAWGKTGERAFRFGERWTGKGAAVGAGALYRQVKTKDEDEINAGKKEATNKDSADNFRIINQELLKPEPLRNWNRVAGLLVGTRENGDGNDIEDAFKEGGALATHAPKLKKIIETGQRAGPPGYRPIVKALFGGIITNPEKFGYNAKYDEETETFTGDEKDIKTLEGFKEKIPEKMTPQDFQGNAIAPENFDPNTPAGRFFIQTMLRERGADFMPQFARRPKKKERDAILRYIFKKGDFKDTGLGKNWLLDNAEDVIRYMDGPGARSAGIGETGFDRTETERLIAEKMTGKTDAELMEEQGDLQNRLKKGQLAGLKPKNLGKIQNRIAQIDKELKLRTKTTDELSREIEEKVKRKVEINAISVEKRTSDLYQELAEIEETLRRDNNELKRKGKPSLEVELPTLEPEPTKKELRNFISIARAEGPIPEKGKLEDRLRTVRGAIRESFKLQQEIEKETKEVEGLLKEAKDRGEATDIFESKLITLKTDLEKLQKIESGPGGLKDKESLLEEEHLKKKK